MDKNFQLCQLFKKTDFGKLKNSIQGSSEVGLTLVEILVALAILAVIGVVAVPNFRQFNSDQEITNSTADVVRVLQQAQTSAQSQIACDNELPDNVNYPSSSYDVVFSSTNSYLLRARCYNAQTGNPNIPTLNNDIYTHSTNNVILSTSLSAVPGCGSPTLRFYSNPTLSVPGLSLKVDFICTIGGVEVMERTFSTVTITLTQSSRTATINLDSSGRVYQ